MGFTISPAYFDIENDFIEYIINNENHIVNNFHYIENYIKNVLLLCFERILIRSQYHIYYLLDLQYLLPNLFREYFDALYNIQYNNALLQPQELQELYEKYYELLNNILYEY